MKILGALLAGGESRRFGSDKALAKWDGRYLIDHTIALLEHQCDHIVICGRQYGQQDFIMDDPVNAGPLGAINAALKYADKHDYDAVISFPCDTILGDTILGDIIRSGDEADLDKPPAWFEYHDYPQYMASQPVIGYWPKTMAAALQQWLACQDRRAVMAWVQHCGAMPIDNAVRFHNINRPSDMPT